MAGVEFKTTIRGQKEVAKALDMTVERARAATVIGNYNLAEIVMDESQKLVPVDTGDLKDSGYVTLPNSRGRIETGYGGRAEAYALMQHEALDFAHPNGGQAKFLEIPFNKYRGSRGLKVIIDFARRAFKLKQKTPTQGNYPTTPWG